MEEAQRMEGIQRRQDELLRQQVIIEQQEDIENGEDHHGSDDGSEGHNDGRMQRQLVYNHDDDLDDDPGEQLGHLPLRDPVERQDEIGHNLPRREAPPIANPMDMMIMMMEHMNREQKAREQEREGREVLMQAVIGARKEDHIRVTPLTPMSKEGDLMVFLDRFEAHMKGFQVPQDKWTRNLIPSMNETLMRTYSLMPADQQNNYLQVKSTLLRQFNVGTETYRRKLTAARKAHSDTWTTFITEITQLHQKWLQESVSREAVITKVVLEHVYNHMPPELRMKVKEKEPRSTREAAEIADTYTAKTDG